MKFRDCKRVSMYRAIYNPIHNNEDAFNWFLSGSYFLTFPAWLYLPEQNSLEFVAPPA